MPFEASLIGYSALAHLAQAVKKHRPIPPLPVMPTPRTARLTGWLLLALALTIAILRFGAAQGIVAWIGQTCVSGVLLVLLLSWRSRLALALSGPTFCLGMSAVFFQSVT